MNEQLDLFHLPVRKISAGVDMNFYVNSNDNDAGVGVFWSDDFMQKNQWRYDNRNQVVSYGLSPKYRYGTLDGCTKLVAPPAEGEECKDACYVCFNSPSTVLPLCFEYLSAGSVGDPQGVSYEYAFAEGQRPKIELDYHGLPRRVNQLMLIGDETWGQYPVSYRVTLRVQAGTEAEAFDSYGTDVPGFKEFFAVKEFDGQVAGEGGASVREVRYLVTGAHSCKQVVRFESTYQAIAVTLDVLTWSAAHTTAKIMYFSNDFSVSMQAGEVSSVSVLEEKTGSTEDLGYGITSNSCTVVVSNADNRFIRNRDLLKRNRNVNPYLVATDLKTGAQSERQSLGKFFSSDWQLTSTSSFVTCKAYDALYDLQDVQLYYTMEQDENEHYVMDGTESGRNANAYLVFEKIFKLINAYKAENGIYGSDVVYRIDERLKNIPMQYVLLGSDTAWNMLQSMANFSLSNVYVDREGCVCVVRDDLRAVEGELPVPEAFSKHCAAAITPSNSFSYNLPSMNKTVVNRVKIPYVTLEEAAEESNTLEFKIESKDFVITKNERGENESITVNLDLDNMYPKIGSLNFYKNVAENTGSLFTPMKESITCETISSTFNWEEDINIIIVRIVLMKLQCYKINTGSTYIEDSALSQSQNGLKEFELKSDRLIMNEDQAKKIAKLLLQNYKDGKSYIETDWQGTPQLGLGMVFDSYSRQSKEKLTYECLSNEFTIDGGLRVKTKARQKIDLP